MKKKFLVNLILFNCLITFSQITVNQQIGGVCIPNRKQSDTTTVTRRVMIINHPSINALNGMPIGTPNILDIRNDGKIGYIEFGSNASKIIDIKGGGTTIAPPLMLKINSTCGANTEIGFGGGFVSAGRNFEIGYPVRNANICSNIFTSGNTRVGQRVTTNHIATEILGPQYNTQLFVNRNFSHALSVFNYLTNTNGDEVFTVYGDGKTEIGKLKIKTGLHTDAKLTVDGKIIGKSFFVTLDNWADFIFDEKYKALNVYETEQFYLKHKHLPNIPSEQEVLSNGGVEIGEMTKLLLMKIEELTLLIVEQQKQIDKLKSK